MKLLLKLLIIAGILGAAFLWLTRSPATELVDAAGGRLTAGASGAEDLPPLAAAEALIEAREFEAARDQLLDELQTSDNDGATCILLSRACLGLQDAGGAVDYARKAVALLPESGAAHHALARSLGLKMVRGNKLAAMLVLPKWKKALFRAVALDPSNLDARTEQIFFYLVTPGLLGGDVEKGMALCRELEQQDPVRGKLMFAVAYFQKGDVDRAIEICQEGADSFPDQAGDFQVTIGGFHARQERYPEADLAYEAAKAGERDEPYYRALYGQAQMRILGAYDQEQAVAFLDEFLTDAPEGDLLPGLSQVWTEKGRALQQLERVEEARAACQEALRIDPGFEPADALLANLGNDP